MKKYMLLTAVIALLCVSQVNAMEKKLTSTNMSANEAKELRKAVVDYKKNRGREKAEQMITWYQNAYPDDPLVKAKTNEIKRFNMKSHIGSSMIQEPKGLEQSQIQEEEKACCICMEDQNLIPIPCKNKHNELICEACLKDMTTCPICREQLNK